MGEASRAVAISGVLLAFLGAGLVATDRDDRSSADVDPADSSGRTLVAGLERAWASRDADAFFALAADSRQGPLATTATWRALRELRVDRLDLRWVGPAVSTGMAPGDSATAVVAVTWTQPGWSVPGRTEVEVVFDDDSGLLDVVARSGQPSPVWALAPLDVRRTATDAQLVGLPGSRLTDRLARQVDAAGRKVAALLPHPVSQLSVVVPGTSGQLAELTGAGDDPLVAGTTRTVDGSVRGDAPVHVLLNPRTLDGLRPAAMAVLLTHEATHAAVGAASTRMPLWVAEGFAEFVALRGVARPVRVLAGEALAGVRGHGPPARLPADADFDTGLSSGSGLARSYELAWLAFRVLERRAGAAATVHFHRSVAAGELASAALRDAAGIGVGQLTRLWRHELVRLAGAAG